MLKKILKIEKIGRFDNYSCGSDTEFFRNTFIYAENGSGKTTLTSILRSLNEQDSSYITSRHTVGEDKQSSVTLLSDGNQKYKFTNGKWDSSGLKFELFDIHFVNTNIYAGSSVSHSHKRELYRFISGDAQIELVKKIDDLDKRSREMSTEITSKKKAIERLKGDLTVEQFVSLSSIDDLTTKIDSCEQEIKHLKKSEVIKSKAMLKLLNIPDFSLPEITSLLGYDLENTSHDAETRVKEHIIQHLAQKDGENWLQQGYTYSLTTENCPFCGQSLSASEIMATYRSYFSIEYKNLTRQIADFETSFLAKFADKKLRELQSTIFENERLLDFWQDIFSLTRPDYDVNRLDDTWSKLLNETQIIIQQKKQHPLESMMPTEQLKSSVSDYENCRELVQRYNIVIEQINTQIAMKKEQLDITSLRQKENQYMNLS